MGDTLRRPYIKPPSGPFDRSTHEERLTYIQLPICKCSTRRGPLGGVCGSCAGAIPLNENEAKP